VRVWLSGEPGGGAVGGEAGGGWTGGGVWVWLSGIGSLSLVRPLNTPIGFGVQAEISG